jgi:hypothetical protein
VISIQPRVFSFRRFAGPVFVDEPICRDEIVEQVGDVRLDRAPFEREDYFSSELPVLSGIPRLVGGIVEAGVTHFNTPLPIPRLVDAAKQGNAVSLKVRQFKPAVPFRRTFVSARHRMGIDPPTE